MRSEARPVRPALLVGVLVATLGVAIVVAAGRGAVAIDVGDVLGSVAHRLGLDLG